MILGFTGPARSGKDTAAEMAIVALYNIHKISRIEKYAFADPLKHAAAAMFGVDVKLMYSDDKDQIDPFWGISYREMLQKLGTEGGRQLFFDDIWVRRAKLEYDTFMQESIYTESPHNIFVITDVRFNNEADWIREEGGEIIHIDRSISGLSSTAKQHASEMGVYQYDGDLIVHNDGSKKSLQNIVEVFIDMIINN